MEPSGVIVQSQQKCNGSPETIERRKHRTPTATYRFRGDLEYEPSIRPSSDRQLEAKVPPRRKVPTVTGDTGAVSEINSEAMNLIHYSMYWRYESSPTSFLYRDWMWGSF